MVGFRSRLWLVSRAQHVSFHYKADIYSFNKFYGDTAVTSSSGVTSKALSSTQTACGTGLSSAGTMLGVAVAPFFNKRYGRKFCFFALGVVGVLGCTVQALSAIRPGLFWVLIAGKIIVNVSIGLASAVVGV